MIGFHDTYEDGIIRLDEIESIDRPHRDSDKNEFRKINFRGGRVLSLYVAQIDMILRRPVQLMPAVPGISLIHYDFGEPNDGFLREPVIAWALCVDGEIRVVTPNGVNGGVSEPDCGFHVEMPDGSVRGLGEYAEPCWADNPGHLLNQLRPKKTAAHGDGEQR